MKNWKRLETPKVENIVTLIQGEDQGLGQTDFISVYGPNREKNAQLVLASEDLAEALNKAYNDIIWFLNYGDFKQKIVWDAGYILSALEKAGKK